MLIHGCIQSHNQLLNFIFVFTGIILWLVLMMFYFSLFKYLWLIVGSPVFAYLSEKTEAIIEERDHPFEYITTHEGYGAGYCHCIAQYLVANGLYCIYPYSFFVPIIGWATPILALLVECYYYGL